MTRLSEHFTLEEFYDPSCYADVLRGRAAPAVTPEEIDGRIVRLMEGLREKFRQRYPEAVLAIRPHGGYRPDPLNALVGGAAGSQHRKGNAADFSVCIGGKKLGAPETAVLTEKYMAELNVRGGVGMYHATDSYIHVDARGSNVHWYASYSSAGCPGQGGVPCIYRRGTKGAGVVMVQRILGVEADGKFGVRTETALKHWQKAYGLTVDGVFGRETNAVMRALPWE